MKKPKIRFKGYQEDWEQRKLGELGSLKNGMNFSKEAMGIGFPFVNLQNIFGNNVIDVTNLGKAMASDSQLKDYNLLNGDVLFVRSSVKLEGVGEAALVPQNLENTTYSGFIIRFRDEYGLDNNFKRFLFGIESVRNQIMAQATNSANKNISQTVLENLCLKIPNKSEQEKIGLYFSNLDHLITLHHRKYMKYADLSVFDWEQRKFADFTWDAGKRNKEDLDLEPYAITNEHGFIRQRDAHDDFGYMKDTDRKAYNIVQPNSFAYNPARINVGSIGYYKGVENVIVSSLYEVFQTDNYVNDRFLWHWLKSDEFPRWIEKLQEGSVRLYFYYDKLCECQLYMPSLEEQEKIATFLDDLDHLITLHQRKCEETKTLKKYMLQKMFPQNGHSVPEIRFSGFTEDWEQRKLGELGSLKNGMNFSKEAMGIGFPFVNLQNIFGNNVIDVTNLGKAMASDSQLKDYNLLNGDVLFVRSSVKLEGVGEAALVPQNLENTTYSGFIIRFRDEYGLDNNFKRFLFGIESVRNQIMAQATNSANKNISQTVLENLCLKIPNKSEQEKIGLYFSNLDHLITLHHRKYMKYADLSVFDWEQRKFADFTWDAGKRNKEDLDLEPYAITNEHGFIRQRDAHDDFGYMKDTDRKAYNIVQPNSFAYNPARINVGSIGYYKGVENVIVSSLYEVFQTDNYVNDRFLWHWLKSDEFPRWIEKLQEGSVRLYFYYDKLCECQLYMPSLEEQEKIATFLDDLDHLITLHQRKCEETKTLKKYMLQKMFPQNGHSVPEIRFSGFTEDWEQRKLVDLVDRVTRKNQDLVSELPLTISAQYGLIDQNEFFDKRVASKDVSGYYLIENGEFAYNKSTSTDAPWGAIKRLDRYKNGVLSTLYIVFGIKENNPVDSDFLVSYYSTNLWHKGIHEIAAEGARNHGLLNIAPADFFETKLMIPQDIEEQKKIGKYFEELERLITLHHRKQNYVLNTLIYAKTTLFITKTS